MGADYSHLFHSINHTSCTGIAYFKFSLQKRCTCLSCVYNYINRLFKHWIYIVKTIIVGTAVLPSIALVIFQQSQVFDDSSHLRVGFMTALNAMDKNSLITLFLSMVFPIAVTLYCFKDIFKDKFYAFGILQMLTNLCITFFVYEDGWRLNHGNFIWSSYFAVGIFCAVSMYKHNKLVQTNRKDAVIITSAILGAHFMGWVNYVFDLLNGGRPF